MRTALDIVRDLVREEQTLAQRLEVVRAQLGALRKLAGMKPSPGRRSGPAKRGRGRRLGAARARRSAAAAVAEERPVKAVETTAARAELIERKARGQAIRELIAKARAEEAEEQASVPGSTPEPETEERPRRAYSPRQSTTLEPGAVFGCWVVVREVAPDSYGRTRYLARATCCGREANKTPATLRGRGKEACSRCTPRTHVGVDATLGRPRRPRGPNTCSACGARGHKSSTCAGRDEASIWVRCKESVPVTTGQANQQAQPFTRCGALVLRTRAAEHLGEVHDLEVDEAELAQHFEAVDPRQGRDEP